MGDTRESLGKEIQFDPDGFMIDADLWDDAIAGAIAGEDGIEEMSEKHWAVVRFIRAYWLKNDLAPAVRLLCKESGVSVREMYKLFTAGPARVLYLVNPREIKFFPLSLMAAAGLFHKAGESWTISSRFYDVTNYGYFSGDNQSAGELTSRVMGEAKRLGVKEVIRSECGHRYRSFRWEGPNWIEGSYPIPMRSVLELVEEYLDDGRLNVDPSKNTGRVTLHDPCNLVRWGGISEPQRRILKQVVTDFEEMTPNRADNFCCGGGGGMLSMSEYGQRRVASGSVKADQIRTTGAKIIATPCHNCADQLLEINKHHKLGVEIQAVVELVYNALV